MEYKGLVIDDTHPVEIKQQYMKLHDKAIVNSKNSILFLKSKINEQKSKELRNKH